MGAHDPNKMFASSHAPHQNKDKNIKIKLENSDLWKKFHNRETEMIITKSGRSVPSSAAGAQCAVVASMTCCGIVYVALSYPHMN